MTIKLFEANESCYIELNFSSIELQKYKIRFIAAGLLGLFSDEAEVARVRVPPEAMRNIIKGKNVYIVTQDANPEYVQIKRYSLAS